jgi:DNA ligase-4
MVDGENVMGRSLDLRKKILEGLLVTIPKHSWIVETKRFEFSQEGTENLAHHFVETIVQGKEGLVLKPDSSTYKPGKYNGHGWFKLKRDYVEGFAKFEKELVVVGGSYGERTGAKIHPVSGQPLLAIYWLAAMVNKDEFQRAVGLFF